MKNSYSYVLMLAFLMFSISSVQAQEEDDDEDYSMYDDFELEDDTPVKRYAKPTISGMSPQKFIGVSFDAQMPYDYEFSEVRFPQTLNNGFDVDEDNPGVNEAGTAEFTGGFRFNTNIPIISKSSFVWQSGINFMDTRYNIRENLNSPQSPVVLPDGTQARTLGQILNEDGLRNINWTNTLFFPLNEKDFIVFQGQMDLSGNYDFDNFQSLNTLRYSAAAVYGRRVNDYYRWGIGISRTYRVGNLNYVPVIMYDWTSKNRKWGTEILFPAKAYVRYNINSNSLLLAGFDLEGQSYRIDDYSINGNSYEIRRGEVRPKLEFQTRISGYIWATVQAGYRMDWSYDADELDSNRDFFRGFFGNQDFGMINNLGNPLFFNVGLNFVSP
ncbi:DUF6268 family outer membrane beta-barrel protein [Psychroflexus montanilacus]|uniref:DUF6268 family outer membrane beta-barrel protein n=1 Tax=Psychroflexus montanilacus TaxID=2873598 RepID=UPI001CCAD577|nr:DUF6268 family outer membrane beta-barrel protein [Psychroflexus montanilacus]MBZ9650629.1 DUF6268 family outer membrane beta-barrel protein [Psychroflexus montanilacus]